MGSDENAEKPLMPMNHTYGEQLDEPHHLRVTARTPEERAAAARCSGAFLAHNPHKVFKPA